MARHVAGQMIREIMTGQPKTVGPKTSVRTLQGLFVSYGFNASPVVDDTQPA
jgi:CBS domain-containing protein